MLPLIKLMAGLTSAVSAVSSESPLRSLPQALIGEWACVSRPLFGGPGVHAVCEPSPLKTLQLVPPLSRSSMNGGAGGRRVGEVESAPWLSATVGLPAAAP